ncbi:MAG: thiamine pyrophosphate-requiring protein [Hyphomicrobiaceae bacterium]
MTKSTKTGAAAAPATAAGAYLALLKSRGVDWLLANAGTDFSPIIEALVHGRKHGIQMPEAVAISHETTAVGMAHGYWLVTGRPQAVMVHVNVGTANAMMGIINASRDQVPMLFTSGRTPVTEFGRAGGRDVPIHWGQEMFDQASMLREFVKFDYELRYSDQVANVVDRALSVAMSEPRGPVYLSLPREALAEAWTGGAILPEPGLKAATSPAPDRDAVAEVAALLAKAKRPLIIAGRGDRGAFDAIAPFADAFGIPVAHFWPARLAIATDHPMHAGFDVGPWVQDADVVLVLDVMVPWLPARHKLTDGVRIVHVGPDPAFHRIPMRSFPGDMFITANATQTVRDLHAVMADMTGAAKGFAKRRSAVAAEIAVAREQRSAALAEPPRGPLTNAWVSRVLSDALDDDAIVVGELGIDPSAMRLTHANAWFGHPIAAGLGWAIPAALGAKLANPDAVVVVGVGDGSCMFANPVACFQAGESLGLPLLTIVFNNGVWNAVRRATRTLYPEGLAVAENVMPLTALSPSPAFEKVVEASGGWGLRVEDAEALPGAIAEALRVVREERRHALLNVIVAPG